MPSAFIRAVHSYPAVPLARQLEHQRYVPPSPLVLGRKPLTFPAPTTDRDRPVSRRSKPSSRTAFIGEQPNPWELLHPQDAMSRHRTDFPTVSCGVDYVFIVLLILGSQANHDLTCVNRSRRVAWIRNWPLTIGQCPFSIVKRRIQAFPFGSVVTGSF